MIDGTQQQHQKKYTKNAKKMSSNHKDALFEMRNNEMLKASTSAMK